jgi:hypothetical protein
MFAASRIRLDNESLPELGIWSGEIARGAALFRQDWQGCERRISKDCGTQMQPSPGTAGISFALLVAT